MSTSVPKLQNLVAIGLRKTFPQIRELQRSCDFISFVHSFLLVATSASNYWTDSNK